jgi:hypothetical protein
VPTCRCCGRARDADTAEAIAWVQERDPDGRERWLCPACARRYVREIEAKLPADWW